MTTKKIEKSCCEKKDSSTKKLRPSITVIKPNESTMTVTVASCHCSS